MMTSRASTPQSRSRLSSGSSSSSDTTMIDAPPHSRPVRLRAPSTSNPSMAGPTPSDPAFSLLLSLPRELRERIYIFTLTSQFPFWWPNQPPVKYHHHVGVHLLRVDKQTHKEAVPILYNANKFLFTHPSDCNIFRVVASPLSSNITSAYFRIRDKDLRLWTSYLGSKNAERSLKSDLPRLKNLWIFLRCGSIGTPAMLGQLNAAQGAQATQGGMGLPPGIQLQVQAVQNALGQQVQALHQQLQNLAQANAMMGAHLHGHQSTGMGVGGPRPPPAPPPPPAMPFLQFAQGGLGFVPQGNGHHHHHPGPQAPHLHGVQTHPPTLAPLSQHFNQTQHNHLVPSVPPQYASFPSTHGQNSAGANAPAPQHVAMGPMPHQQQPHPLYTNFLRFEREIGLESLCLSLQEPFRERYMPSSRSASRDRRNNTTPLFFPRATSGMPDVKIVCIMRVPHREVERLICLYPNELVVDRNGDARTKFRKLHGVEVSLEVSGYSIPGIPDAEGEVDGEGVPLQ